LRTVNVGVIGTGGIASNAHMPALEKQAEVKILAVCDVNEESAKRAADRFKVPHIFADYQKLLAMEDLEAVHICTPNNFHMQPTIDALEAGKHVIVEKPIGRNSAEGSKMSKRRPSAARS